MMKFVESNFTVIRELRLEMSRPRLDGRPEEEEEEEEAIRGGSYSLELRSCDTMKRNRMKN